MTASQWLSKAVLRRRPDRTVDGSNVSAEALHEGKVQRIADELRHRKSSAPLSLKKKAPPHQVPKRNDLRRHDDKLDISDLDQILHIDPDRRLCVAEPGVTFVDLVEATLAYGLVPIVVPELKTITIGGAVAGCSIESMSFEHGGFHDTCVEYEVITARGEVLICRRDNEHQLIFQMVHGTFGTLGIVSKLTFKLVPAKRFVHVIYEKHTTLDSYMKSIEQHYREKDIDFMDGIIHSPSLYVLSTANFVDKAPYTNRYDWTKVYYTSTAKRREDYLETPQYFFRYDRGVTNVVPKSFLGRLVLGKFFSSNELLHLADKHPWLIPDKTRTVTLDVFIPLSRVPRFLEWYQKEINHFPLWCVPYRRVHDYEWLSSKFFDGMQDELLVDLALYGLKQRPGDKNYHRLMELALLEIGGVKTLIDHNYYTPEEFWTTWNKPNYEAAKRITDPDNVFRDLYTKTCRAVMGLAD